MDAESPGFLANYRKRLLSADPGQLVVFICFVVWVS